MRIALSVFLVAALTTLAAVEPPKDQDSLIKRLPNWNDAAVLALMDLRAMPEIDQPFQRYLWITDGDTKTAQMMAAVPNIVSRGTEIFRPVPMGADKLLLMRMDLRLYAPRTQDLKDWLTTWEELRNEPRFSLLITKDTINQLVLDEGEAFPTVRKRVTHKTRLKGRNGKTKTIFTEVDADVSIKELKDLELARLIGRHVNLEVWQELVTRTQSQAPVVTHGYLLTRMLTTIQEDQLWKELYGGLYYEFAGVKENKTGKGTDEDLWFQDHLGLGDVAAGLTARKIYDRIRSDRRIGIWKSQVTGKPRAIDYAHGPNEGEGTGNWAISHDPRDKDIDVARHPMFNLLNLKDAAREAIWGKANGFHGYAMFDGNGKLAREVPFDVAVNRKIPGPHTARLQGGIGCISCHETESEGWQPLRNDVRDLLPAILGDTARAKETIPDTLDELRSKYAGDPTKWLNRGRDDYSAAFLKATGPLDKDDPANKGIVKTAGALMWKVYVEHNYEPVTAHTFLRDLGLDAPEKDSPKVLRALLQPTPDQVQGLGVPMDVRLLALMQGQSINRVDSDLVFGFAAVQAQRKLAAAKPKEDKKEQPKEQPK